MKLRHLILIAALLASGCTSMEHQRSTQPDPDQRLNNLLAHHSDHLSDSSPCLEMTGTTRAVTDCERLVQELERLQLDFPNHPRIAVTYAIMVFQYGQPRRAAMVLDQVLVSHPLASGAALLRARIATQQGNLTLAERLANDHLRRRPDDALMYETLAAIRFVQGQYEQATAQLEQARRLGSPQWRLAFHHALIAEMQSNTQRACRLYEVAMHHKHDLRAAEQRFIGLRGTKGCSRIATSELPPPV